MLRHRDKGRAAEEGGTRGTPGKGKARVCATRGVTCTFYATFAAAHVCDASAMGRALVWRGHIGEDETPYSVKHREIGRLIAVVLVQGDSAHYTICET